MIQNIQIFWAQLALLLAGGFALTASSLDQEGLGEFMVRTFAFAGKVFGSFLGEMIAEVIRRVAI